MVPQCHLQDSSLPDCRTSLSEGQSQIILLFFCFDVKGSAPTLGASDVCQGQQIFQAVLLVVGLKRCDKSYYLVLGSLAGGLKREKLHRDATKAQKRDSGPIKCVAASAVWTVRCNSPSLFGVSGLSEAGEKKGN